MVINYLRENGYQGVIPEVLLTDEAHSFTVDSKDKETGAKRREKIYFSINDMANPDLAFSQLFGHEKDKEHYGILVAAGIIFYVYGPEIAETTVKYAPLFLSMMLEPPEINKEDEIDNLDDIKNFKSIVISNRGNEILDNSEETNNFGQKGVNVYYTKKQSRKSGKELGNDYPG